MKKRKNQLETARQLITDIFASDSQYMEIMPTEEFKAGWTPEEPPCEWENWLMNFVWQFMLYVQNLGSSQPWNAEISYDKNAVVTGSDGKTYKSNNDKNKGNDPVTDKINWRLDSGDAKTINSHAVQNATDEMDGWIFYFDKEKGYQHKKAGEVGEANEGENIGKSGIGLYSKKDGVKLQFYKLNSKSGKILITQDGENETLDFTVKLTKDDVGLSEVPNHDFTEDVAKRVIIGADHTPDQLTVYDADGKTVVSKYKVGLNEGDIVKLLKDGKFPAAVIPHQKNSYENEFKFDKGTTEEVIWKYIIEHWCDEDPEPVGGELALVYIATEKGGDEYLCHEIFRYSGQGDWKEKNNWIKIALKEGVISICGQHGAIDQSLFNSLVAATEEIKKIENTRHFLNGNLNNMFPKWYTSITYKIHQKVAIGMIVYESKKANNKGNDPVKDTEHEWWDIAYDGSVTVRG